MRSKKTWVVPIAALLAAAIYGGTALATPQQGVTTTTLANKIAFGAIDINAHTLPADIWQARLNTRGSTDGYVVDNVIQPGGTTGWHSHPGPSLIFVIHGAVTNYTSDDPTCTVQVYPAGSGFVDQGGGDVHMLKNNGSSPAETIAVQLLPQGATRRIDADTPANCTP
jgi:quercetin dioxygenase-like cupin family protein